MTPKLSPLEIQDFAILNCSFAFTPFSEEFKTSEQIQEAMKAYEIDIDFAMPRDKGINVFVKVTINHKSKMPGYSIMAEGVSVFKLNENTKMDEVMKSQLTSYSAFSITLNAIRGFIASLTANSPYERYILPSIDVNDMFQQKTDIAIQKAKGTAKIVQKTPLKAPKRVRK